MRKNFWFLFPLLAAIAVITPSSCNMTAGTRAAHDINSPASSHFKCHSHGNESAFNQLKDHRIVLAGGESGGARKILTEHFDVDKTKRYSLIISQPSPLTINISSNCHHSPAPPRPPKTSPTPATSMTWNIFYNRTINFGNFLRNAAEPVITFKCLPPGQYDFLVTSTAACKWNLEFALRQHDNNWPFLNLTSPSRIRLQNRPQRRQVVVKWEKSKLDIHAINYCLAINLKIPQQTLCSAAINSLAVSPPTDVCENFYKIEMLQSAKPERIRKLDQGSSLYCTGFKSQQILRGLQLTAPYFIDVFAIHTKFNNFSYLLGSSETFFNRTHPIALTEEKTAIGKLSDLGGVSVFSLKIPRKATSSISLLHISLIPCGGSIDIRIMKQKQKVLFKKNLYKPTIMTMENTVPGNRYILRVTPSTEDDVMRVNKVELTFTTKSHFHFLPVLPKNITVVEFVSARSCRSTTIAWFGSPDHRKIKYCIYVLKLSMKNRDFDNTKSMNFCEIDSKLANNQDFQQMYCFYPEKRNEMEIHRITGLSSGRHYYVHLTATLINGKSLPYESVRIKTHTKCRKQAASDVVDMSSRATARAG